MSDILKNKKQILTMTAAVTVSAAFQAFALTSFSVPAGIYPSGISGMSRLVSDILMDFFKIDLPFFVLTAFDVVLSRCIEKGPLLMIVLISLRSIPDTADTFSRSLLSSHRQSCSVRAP